MRRDSRIPRTLRIAAAFEGEKIGHIAGDIVKFRGDGSPLRALTLGIDPVQDLHGFDSPWPAGGGVNLANLSTATARNDGTYGMYTTISGETITVSGTWSGDTSAKQWRFLNTPDIPTDLSIKVFEITSGNHVYAITQDGDNHRFVIDMRDMVSGTTYNIQFKVVAYSGTAPTAWTPYSNLCPISGHTGANLWRTGRNLVNRADGNTNAQNWWIGCTPQAGEPDGSFVLAAGTYTFSVSDTMAGLYVRIKGKQIAVAYNNTALKFAMTESAPVKLSLYKAGVTSAYWDTLDIQLELSSTPTPYTPYTGTTIPVTWSEAGTVYGGTWDVLSGVLRVTHQLWAKNTADMDNADVAPGWRNSGIKELIGSDVNTEFSNQIMNIGKYWSANTNGSNDILFLRTARYNKTQTEWIALAIDVQIAVELATPLTYTLTPAQLVTLAGQNVVWGDTGTVEVEYVCDNGVEGGKLALLLRNKPELLIAMRKGAPASELLLAMGGRGDSKPSITPLKPVEEKKDEDEEAMRK